MFNDGGESVMTDVEFNDKVLEIVMEIENVVGYAKVQADTDEGLFNLGTVMKEVSSHVEKLGWDVSKLQWSTVHPIGLNGIFHVYFYTQEFLDKESGQVIE